MRQAGLRDVLAVREFRALWAAGWTSLTFALTSLPALVGGVQLSGLAGRYPRRALVALSWLVGVFTIPEGLAAPYAATLGATATVVGLLMAADPAGSIIGAWLAAKLSHKEQLTAWFAVGAGVPLALPSPATAGRGGAALGDLRGVLHRMPDPRAGGVHPGRARPPSGRHGWTRQRGGGVVTGRDDPRGRRARRRDQSCPRGRNRRCYRRGVHRNLRNVVASRPEPSRAFRPAGRARDRR